MTDLPTRHDNPIIPADLPTRHENPTNPADLPTRHENASRPADLPTRHENSSWTRTAGTGTTWFGQLPRGVQQRYDFIRALSTAGAQADVLLFRERATGREVVVKLFRGRPQINHDTYDKLRAIPADHVTPILDLRVEEDGVWEVQEYLRHGSLVDLLQQRGGGPQPVAFVRSVVEELTPALAAIHAREITHRDLKPGNILVRTSDPLDLVLGDFGFARDITMSAEYMSVVGVFHYTAPEAISGEAGPAIDWWSLGVIAYELLTGHSLFLDAAGNREPDQRVVQRHLHRNTYSLDAVTDPRWNLLLRGLLNRSRVHRWTDSQVDAWLAGESPEVVERPEAPEAIEAYALAPLSVPGGQFTDPAELVVALAGHWDEACTYLTGQGATHLSHWLADTPHGARTRRLLSSVRATDLSPQEALILLQVILAPDRPVSFQGRFIDGPTLTRAAQGAISGNASDQSWIRDLRAFQVLAALGGHDASGTTMATADVRLRQMWDQTYPLLQQARRELETRDLVDVTQGRLEGFLLAAALDPAQGERALAASARVAARVPDDGGQLQTWVAQARDGYVPAAHLLDSMGPLVLDQRARNEKAARERAAEATRQAAQEAAARAAREAAANRRQRLQGVRQRAFVRVGAGAAWVALVTFVTQVNAPSMTPLDWEGVALTTGLPLLAVFGVAAVLEAVVPARPSTPAYGLGMASLAWFSLRMFPNGLDQNPAEFLEWLAALPYGFIGGYVAGFLLGWWLARWTGRRASAMPLTLRAPHFLALVTHVTVLVYQAVPDSAALNAGAWATGFAGVVYDEVSQHLPVALTGGVAYTLVGVLALLALITLPASSHLPRGLRWTLWILASLASAALVVALLPFLIANFWVVLGVAFVLAVLTSLASGKPA